MTTLIENHVGLVHAERLIWEGHRRPHTNGNGHHTPAADWRIAATYDYTDVAGALRYQVVRLEPKDFRCRRPDGHGGWTWNMNGVAPPWSK